MKTRIGVIGTGKIALKHLEVLAAMPDVEIAAIANRSNPVIDELARTYRIGKTFRDHRALLRSGLDGVVVAPSVLANVAVSRDCLEHGMPSLLEKPAGLMLSETAALAELAAARGVRHMVGLNRRYYSSVKQAQAAIAEKGPLVAVAVEAPEKIEQARVHPPEVREHWLVANGIHCLDLFRHLGGEVQSVHSIARQRASEQPDSFAALVQFANGAAGQYTSHWTTPGGWTVTLYGMGRRVTLKPLEKCTVVESDGSERVLEPDPIDVSYKPGLYAQMRAFVEMVQSGQPAPTPACDLASAVATMRMIEQIERGQ